MPRPTDHYTHAQFEPIESDFRGETVQCVHCKNWSGSVKTLSRKKEHLLKCPSYVAWRATGNGQDLQPPNKYSKRESGVNLMDGADPYSSTYEFSPDMRRPVDINKFFDEFWDGDSAQKVSEFVDFLHIYEQIGVDIRTFIVSQIEDHPESPFAHELCQVFLRLFSQDKKKQRYSREDLMLMREQCMRVRCKSCGFVRAKNATRQLEHIQQCQDFINSSEGQEAVNQGLLTMRLPNEQDNTPARSGFLSGRAPNPTFNPSRKQHNIARRDAPPKPSPSLVNHLLSKNAHQIESATQVQFLSHAGCGTLSATALQQWLTQQGHMSRALISYIGSLIGKIRLPDTRDPSTDTTSRTVDLLISALNNAKRELDFLRTTQSKYHLQQEVEACKPPTKGFLDLLASVSSPQASLLEGMMILWSIQHLYNISWQYAASCILPTAPASTSYTVPSYLQPGQYHMSNPYAQPRIDGGSDDAHNIALKEALIPNWTSEGFTKFVDACKSIVDELANAQTTGNGAAELNNCEANFRQAIWLWRQLFPEVTGMGEEDEEAADADEPSHANGHGDRSDGPIEIPDDEDGPEEDAPMDGSPYGGTGLGAVAAANRGV